MNTHDELDYLMNRLPGYDIGTSRGEMAAFVTLGVAALVSIWFPVSDATRFTECRDCIIATLSAHPSVPVQEAADAGRTHALTNVPATPRGASGSQAPRQGMLSAPQS